MSPADIVQKLWNYCNVLRDDGMSCGDYVDYWSLEEEEGVTAAMMREIALELSHQAEETISTPLAQRGKQG